MTDEPIDGSISGAPDSFEEQAPPQEYPLNWSLACSGTNSVADTGRGIVTMDAERLCVNCIPGPPFDIYISDIRNIIKGDHQLQLELSDGSLLTLSHAGRLHDALTEELTGYWMSVIKKEELVEEKLIAEFQGVFASKGGDTGKNYVCNVSVYETGLAILWENGDSIRIPYPFTGYPKDAGWLFEFSLPDGTVWEIGKLGRRTDEFRESVSKAIGALDSNALNFVRKLDRSLSPLKARSISNYFIDGKAVSKAAIMRTAPELWACLEEELKKAGLEYSWSRLAAAGCESNARIGIKRGLRGGGNADYAWFFIPVLKNGRGYIVMEASSQGTEGRATYIFSVSPEAGSSVLDPSAFLELADKTMDILNYGLYMVNFRREPVYVTEEQLKLPKFQRYVRSIERIPALKMLRSRFAGRVSHKDEASWEKGVMELISTP